MSYEFYKVLHLFGLSLILLPLGAIALHAFTGASKSELTQRKALLATHGVGMLLVFVAGFGLIAKLQLGWPAWIWVKMLIWLFLGGLVALLYKRKMPPVTSIWIIAITVAIATFLARYKPF
ncbi:MAG: hypothetical protein KDD25_07035 [Bdellovibrionales bacterium]|nr:hypothetical protein [Bdellovibrionales bacterium]